MRYAIVSDLHANLQAWNSVLLDIRSNHVEHIISLGDVVGYGPSPAEVLQSAHSHIHSFVMGNHDAVVCGKLNDALFNPEARKAIRRTRRQLGERAIPFLAEFPLLLDGGSFLCTHGDFVVPEAFQYILDERDAAESWKSFPHPLLFAGHTHQPALYLLGSSGTPHAIPPQDFELESGKRYLVNVGSVGCPRDNDPRASYCIYDTTANAVFWRRIPYDLDAHRQEYERHQIDPASSVVLHADPRRDSVPLRERLDFSPATLPGESAVGVTGIATIKLLENRVKRWKAAASVLLGTFALAIAVSALLLFRYSAKPGEIGMTSLPVADARVFEPGRNLLHHPPASSRNAVISGWTISLADRRHQWVEVLQETNDRSIFVLSSSRRGYPMHIMSVEIQVSPGMQFYPDALFAKSPDFQGTVGIRISLLREGDAPGMESLSFYSQEPGAARINGWARARRTFTIPAKGSRIRMRIGGDFKGTVQVKNLSLTCSQAGR